jgi:hypothetical protein
MNFETFLNEYTENKNSKVVNADFEKNLKLTSILLQNDSEENKTYEKIHVDADCEVEYLTYFGDKSDNYYSNVEITNMEIKDIYVKFEGDDCSWEIENIDEFKSINKTLQSIIEKLILEYLNDNLIDILE